MGKNNQPPKRAEIQAKDLVAKLKEAKKKRELVYTLYNTNILDNLDLKHCTVEVALDIQHCDFQGWWTSGMHTGGATAAAYPRRRSTAGRAP
jgi:hypothetical protein